ncbi:MAG: ATP-dependent DNA helicase [Candidatus Thalassarchaeaceae archaeon]|nr:ATP-dependent DNA helicase [Candidatus Thalassarchaeaceae archaeon]
MSGEGVANSNLFFAHETPRESQIGMISDGIDSLKNEGFLLAAAPTGIGKTAAALASALNAANQSENAEIPKILFLTGRQSQHRIVVDTIREINKRLPSGFSRVKVVDIIGREGMCKVVDRSTGKCNCEIGVTESERRFLRADLEDFIHSEPRHVDQILKRVRKTDVCAWATAREAAKNTRVIVCDYNHVFVEGVRDASLPVMGVDLENTILIVDEAHNLPDRIRSGLERRVTERVFQRALSDVEEYKESMEKREVDLEMPESNQLREAKSLEKQIRALRDDAGLREWFEEKKAENKQTKGDDVRVATQDFLDVVSKAIGKILEEDPEDDISRLRMMIARLLSVVIEEDEDSGEDEQNDCTRLAEILEICIRYRKNSALALVFDELLDEPRVTSHLLDPSVVGEPIFEQCLGSILMSGTLFPPEMYAEILGIPRSRSSCIEYSSGFPLGNRPVLIASDVTSKYTERDECFSSIISHVKSVIDNTKGNVAIFAPSYSMLDKIHGEFENSWSRKKIIKEEQRMSKSGVESLISKLYEHKQMGGSALFGVLSGKLSEGVDYSENVLSALVCVGLPLPPPSAKQDALLEYYSKKYDRNRAWKYASLQPAVNSILQALGRPIRKKEDRAIVILLEKRLLERRVSDCMPAMQKMRTSKPERTAERVKAFFGI